MNYFFKNLLLNSQAKIRQTTYIEMMTREGSPKNYKIYDPLPKWR